MNWKNLFTTLLFGSGNIKLGEVNRDLSRGMISNVMNGLTGRYTGSNLTPAEEAANAFNASEAEKARQFSAQEAEKARNFEAEMANTAKQRQVADFAAAGINPMFAAGQSVSLPSASNAASVAASGVSPSAAAFNLPSLISAISQLRVNKAQADALHSQSEQSKAAADNLRSDAALKDAQRRGHEFINEVNDLTKDVQVQQKKANLDLSNKQLHLSDKQLKEIDKKMELMDADIAKKMQETNSEIAKQALMLTQQAVNRASAHLQYMQAKEINEMLVYNKQLAAARTMHEKAAAGLAGIQAAYQNGLITGGYIDKLIEKVGAEAGIKLNEKQISDINTALRTGDYSNTNINDKSLFQQIFTSEGFVQAATIFLDNFNPLSGLIGIAP